MDVLLLAGYRSAEPLGLEPHASGRLMLDVRIEQLRHLGLSPIVVLSGNHADEQLRQVRSLEKCELVFDTNGDEATLFTNLRSGLNVAEQACFVFPVEIPVPPEFVWKQLKTELLREGFLTDKHVFQLADEGAPWHYGFPILLSEVGRKVILNLKNPTGLTDPRIRYYFSSPPLAHSAVSL